ncbi:ATPase, partial [Phocaeicola vulgatus]|nr:ATPase [Phocaeicola vulgatus]
EAFINRRLMGARFVYHKNDFCGTASVHVESEALKKKSNELGKMGYGGMSRLVYRPLHDTGRLFLLGISVDYET